MDRRRGRVPEKVEQLTFADAPRDKLAERRDRIRELVAAGDPPSFLFADLFAGIGGFRIALEELGGKCVFTCEIDPHARRTYSEWFGVADDDPSFARDVREVRLADVPRHDILAAGFPCQPFSLAGVSKKNSLNRPHGLACPSQGTLFENILEIAEAKRTPMLLLENVKHLLNHDGGNTWDVITKKLQEAGYMALSQVIDARYWVPQHRERIFIACFRIRDLDPPFDPDFLKILATSDTPLVWPIPPEVERPTLDDILEREENVDRRYVLSRKLWNYLRKYRDRHQRAGHGFGYGLVDPNDKNAVTRTLSARYHKDGSEILISRGPRKNPRRLTPVECARLMGFDTKVTKREDIPVSDTQAYRQFGNALVPAVAREVALTMLAIADMAGLLQVSSGDAPRREAVAG